MPSNPHPSTVSGRVDVTHLLRAGQRRAVRVYLPPDYEASGRRYPVLYMFDGHNLFDRRTSSYDKEWRIDEHMEALFGRDPHATAVVVGIDPDPQTLARYAEYSVIDWTYRGSPADRVGSPIVADGETTARFIAGTVKPWVEQNYRVAADRDNVGIGGSSMGGYMALYLAVRFPELFAKVLAFSPAVLDRPMEGARLRSLIAASVGGERQRIYLDMGSAEELEYVEHPDQMVAVIDPLVDALTASGRSDITSHIAEGAPHDETAWGARFPAAFHWAFHGQAISPPVAQPRLPV